MLPVAWSLTVKEAQRLRVLKNRIVRDIFGPNGAKVTEDWRRLRNEELHD
jgi:hypothetical protein